MHQTEKVIGITFGDICMSRLHRFADVMSCREKGGILLRRLPPGLACPDGVCFLNHPIHTKTITKPERKRKKEDEKKKKRGSLIIAALWARTTRA